jgi:hypothetical protein
MVREHLTSPGAQKGLGGGDIAAIGKRKHENRTPLIMSC